MLAKAEGQSSKQAGPHVSFAGELGSKLWEVVDSCSALLKWISVPDRVVIVLLLGIVLFSQV